MDASKEIIALLQQQNQLLLQMLQAQQKPQADLGWSNQPPSQAKWLFVKRNNTSCLYTLDSNDMSKTWDYSTITGYIVSIELTEVERMKKLTDKLNVTVDTGNGLYTISMGAETHCARSLLGCLIQLDSSALSAPISLTFAPANDNPSIVWCRVGAPKWIKAREIISVANAVTEITNRKTRLIPMAESTEAKQLQSKDKAQLKPVKATIAANAPVQQLPATSIHNNELIATIRNKTGHDREWIVAQCSIYGAESPASLNWEQMRGLVESIAIDYLYTLGIGKNPAESSSIFRSQINALMQKGQQFKQAVLFWFENYNRYSNGSPNSSCPVSLTQNEIRL